MRRSRIATRPRSTSRNWLVTLPAWGDRCVDVACRYTLPALLAALAALGHPARILVWTDQSARMRDLFESAAPSNVSFQFLAVPGPDRAFKSLSACHAEALAAAEPMERVLLLTADMLVSHELLVTCEHHIHSRHMQLICCCAMRTRQAAPVEPPTGVIGPVLLEWAWANRHRMTRECTWPDGTSYDVWRMYFESGRNAAARVFLPHPLVVTTRGRPMRFGPTIDVNLSAAFSRSHTYMLTMPYEGAVVELSPDDKEFMLTEPMRTRLAHPSTPSVPQLIRCTNQRHRMFFEKRVVICGDGEDFGDGEVVEKVLG